VQLVFVLLAGLLAFNLQVRAATLCVNPGGATGCYPKIAEAVKAASSGDTVLVGPGTYHEDVVIAKSLSLLGADRHSTIIDAKGLGTGVFIDGIDAPGLSAVVVSGFTIENANFEGIFVANATDVTVRDNEITRNDQSLKVSGSSPPSCPGIPAFETGEAVDCGEGVHLMAVDHSVIEGNTILNNAGGILLSDETGPTHENLISGNLVKGNSLDCGITLASHAANSGAPESFGVFHNTISSNESDENGLANGGGAGVGIFAGKPGNRAYGNIVMNNRLIGNGLPGVTIHNHADSPSQPADLSDNLIVGNFIARNHADTQDAATSGPTGINVFGVGAILGTIISQNTIREEAVDVVTNTPGEVLIHLNDFGGGGVGVANIGAGSVDATENWWGCSSGPGSKGCAQSTGSRVTFIPSLRAPPAESGNRDNATGPQGNGQGS
jgi:parallel beta-helix repeat protein